MRWGHEVVVGVDNGRLHKYQRASRRRGRGVRRRHQVCIRAVRSDLSAYAMSAMCAKCVVYVDISDI